MRDRSNERAARRARGRAASLPPLLCALLLAAALSLPSCRASRPPRLEDVYDRFVALIEASGEVNAAIFGAGLPSYPRGGAEERVARRYYGAPDDGLELVAPQSPYRSIDELREAVSRVYGRAYRASLFETLFTGMADAEVSLLLPARYVENERGFLRNSAVTPVATGLRSYDYAGMRMLGRSTATRVRVEIPSRTDARPEWTRARLAFVYEDGAWYLDSPTC